MVKERIELDKLIKKPLKGKLKLEDLSFGKQMLVIKVFRPDGQAKSKFTVVYNEVAIGFQEGLGMSNELNKPEIIGYTEDGKMYSFATGKKEPKED